MRVGPEVHQGPSSIQKVSLQEHNFVPREVLSEISVFCDDLVHRKNDAIDIIAFIDVRCRANTSGDIKIEQQDVFGIWIDK
jgi:hypothetical protein